jgi:4-amino-4-deoxy-L-arabinose transferase-like glycosyltransferase
MVRRAQTDRTRRGKRSRDPIPSRSSPFWTPRRAQLGLGLLLAFSTTLGLACVWQFRQSPFFEVPIVDESGYVSWAQELLEGGFVSDKVFYQDPLYPYFLAVLFKLFGKSFLVVRLLQVAMGTCAVALVFRAARTLLGNGLAVLAASILAFFHGMYFFELQLEKATLVLFLSSAAVALGVASADRPDARWRWAALGLVLGLLCLLRGNLLPILPFLVVWAFFAADDRRWSVRLARSGLVLAGLAFVLLPVSFHNYRLSKELILTTNQGGANFFIGNNENANGRNVALPFVRASPRFEAEDFTREAERLTGGRLSPREVSRFWFREGLRWIRENPAAAARLWLEKARLTVHDYEVPDNHNFYLLRQLYVPAFWIPFLGFGMLWGPAVVGVWILVRSDRRAWFPALFGVLYLLSLVPFFVVDRYRPAAVPALAVFASGALGALARNGAWRTRRMAIPAGLAIALSWAISFSPVEKEPLAWGYYEIANLHTADGRPGEAIGWYDRALAELPGSLEWLRSEIASRRETAQQVAAIFNSVSRLSDSEEAVRSGNRLLDLDQPRLAKAAYEKALALDPHSVPALGWLGTLCCIYDGLLDTEQGFRYLRQALERSPDDPDLLTSLGFCYYWSGERARARETWQAVLARHPDFAAARDALAGPNKLLQTSY